MLDKSDISSVLECAVHAGADFAELYIENRDELSIACNGGALQSIAKARRNGAGLYLISGVKSTYLYTNNLRREDLLELVTAGVQMLDSTQMGTFRKAVIPIKGNIDPCPVHVYPSSVENARKIRVLENSYKAAMCASKYIKNIDLTYFDMDQRVTIINSEGLWAEDRRVTSRVRRVPRLVFGSDSVGHFSDFTRPCGFEVFSCENYIESVETAIKDLEETLFADEAPVGRMPVVFDGGGSCGTFFHEACGHQLETSNLKGISVFKDSLGKKIASEKVTLIDDGTLPGQYGSSVFDDEGMSRQRNVLIEKGILKSYMADRLGSLRYHVPRTGSGRRQDYTYAPCARMSNTFLAAGDDDEDEMISTMPKGLLVASIGGGTEGEGFSLEAQKCYLIKNGKIDRPVKGAIVTGRSEESMLLIDRVSNRFVCEDGGAFCGSMSGLVNTTTSGARMRVAEMMVGGTGGVK